MGNLFDTPETIRALSWKQPYASLMTIGKIETRNRPTNVRGKVLICACVKPYDIELLNEIAGNRQYERICKTQMMNYVDENDLYGKAIAIADLVGCYPMNVAQEDECYVQYKSGLWCWKFENVQRIEPFEFKGKQGWSILDADTISKIKILPSPPQTT